MRGQPLTDIHENIIKINHQDAPSSIVAFAGKPHIHQIPMFAYVLSGVVSVDYGDHGVRTYQQGEALMEAQNMVHFGFKNGSDPVSLLVVYIGSAELSNAELP